MVDLKTPSLDYSPSSVLSLSIVSFLMIPEKENESFSSSEEVTQVEVQDIKSFKDLKIYSRNESIRRSSKEEVQKRCLRCSIF
jgi:hypothetical protein